jgi:hypothetical protein
MLLTLANFYCQLFFEGTVIGKEGRGFIRGTRRMAGAEAKSKG